MLPSPGDVQQKSLIPSTPMRAAFSGPLFGFSAFNQFILYRLVPSTSRPGKTDKLPCSHVTGQLVSAHDSQHWMDAETATSVAAAWGPDWGVGFVFTESDPFFFLDIDGCLVNGQWSDLALSICAAFAGCAIEVSQSGTGLHIFGTGRPPAHGCRNQAMGLEFYHSGRFVALTGTNPVGNCLTDASAVLPALVAMYFPSNASSEPGEWSEGHELGWELPNDDELIRRALSFGGGANAAFSDGVSFADLWTRNVSKLSARYPDDKGRDYEESGADLALAGKLAWLTGNDCPRIERLMRQSALMRDKWDSHKTYLSEFTIPRSLKQDGEFYNPKYKEEKRQEQITAAASAVAALGAPGGAPGALVAAGGIDLQGIEAALLQLKTQDSCAQIFELKQAGKLLFNHSRGEWLEWDGTRWKLETTQKAFDFARALSRAKNWEGASSMGSASFCGGVEKFAQASRTFAIEGDQFDRDNYLLNTPAGTLDLRSGKMREHSPEDRITKCTAASPDTGGDGVAFRKFMMEITGGDEELIRFHQVSLGACLSGAIEDHWLLFWTGVGRNGKNTLGDLVEELMGDYARTIASSTLMAKSNEGHLAEIAQLQGVRIAISSEINDGDHWNEGRIKELTGNATINARFMRQDHFTFQRTQKHLIYGNHRPQLRSVDAAIHSRIKIVPFKVSFLGREDKGLGERLRAELGYVLQWLIDGHQQWLAAGKKLPKCAAVEAESADYFASQSTPEMWLKERCEILTADDRPARQLPGSGDLYRDYSDWKKARGEQPISQTRWAQGVMRGYEKVQSTFGIRYKGLRLLPLALPFSGAPFPVTVPAPPTTATIAPLPEPSSEFEKFVAEIMGKEQEIT